MRDFRRRFILVPTLLALGASLSAVRAEGTKRSFERVLKVAGPVEVSLNANSSDLRIVSGTEGTVRVRVIVTAQKNGAHFPEDFEEQVNYLESNPPLKQEGNHIVLGDSAEVRVPKSVSVDYELTVPAATRLSFESHSGDLWTEGIRGPVTVQTESGDIRMRSVREAIRIRTTSGDISLSQAEAGGINIETTSGDVSLQLPEKAGFDMSVHTASGDISVSPTFAGGAQFAEHEANLKVHGGGVPVEIRTTSGDVSIQPATRTERVAAN